LELSTEIGKQQKMLVDVFVGDTLIRRQISSETLDAILNNVPVQIEFDEVTQADKWTILRVADPDALGRVLDFLILRFSLPHIPDNGEGLFLRPSRNLIENVKTLQAAYALRIHLNGNFTVINTSIQICIDENTLTIEEMNEILNRSPHQDHRDSLVQHLVRNIARGRIRNFNPAEYRTWLLTRPGFLQQMNDFGHSDPGRAYAQWDAMVFAGWNGIDGVN
jgi:hypothetical protein